jgi:hypothetical protein
MLILLLYLNLSINLNLNDNIYVILLNIVRLVRWQYYIWILLEIWVKDNSKFIWMPYMVRLITWHSCTNKSPGPAHAQLGCWFHYTNLNFVQPPQCPRQVKSQQGGLDIAWQLGRFDQLEKSWTWGNSINCKLCNSNYRSKTQQIVSHSCMGKVYFEQIGLKSWRVLNFFWIFWILRMCVSSGINHACQEFGCFQMYSRHASNDQQQNPMIRWV